MTMDERVLAEAQKLHDEGRWHEAVRLLAKRLPGFIEITHKAEARRIEGSCFFQIGVKGPVEEMGYVFGLSQSIFELALAKTSDPEKRLSISQNLFLLERANAELSRSSGREMTV